MSIQTQYPHLWAFFDGAFSANSGGKAREEDFRHFSAGDMQQAEEELTHFNRYVYEEKKALEFTRWLGMMADMGYNVWGQTHQDLPDGSLKEVDDEQHRLLAFELLDTRY